jgi:hypothetical protein
MPSIRPEDLSPFGRAALKLDREFAELAAVGAEMASVDVGSDGGLDEGIKLLNRAARCGQDIADSMQTFSSSLQEARDRADAAMKTVAERAQLISKRREEQDKLQEKLSKVKDEVQAAGAGLAESFKAGAGAPSADEKARIAAELERVRAPMSAFIEAAKAVKAEAAAGNFKRVARQADSVIDSLQASLRKIEQALAAK